jgi:hypothetical protein
MVESKLDLADAKRALMGSPGATNVARPANTVARLLRLVAVLGWSGPSCASRIARARLWRLRDGREEPVSTQAASSRARTARKQRS